MKEIVILGGDYRQLELFEILKKNGFSVSLFGFEITKRNTCGDIGNCLKSADYLFLPIPVKFDNGRIVMPFSTEKIYITNAIKKLKKNAHVIFGGLDPTIYERIMNDKNHFVDLLKNEAYLSKNAMLTAEAALAIAMLKSRQSFSDMTVSILGYGRIGTQISNLLISHGGNINICTSKPQKVNDESLRNGYGNNIKAYHTHDALDVINNSDIVFNTIPHRMFNKDKIDQINKDVIIYELASYPFGFDVKYAKNIGINISAELGLPGRFFSKSAGKVIFESFKKIDMENNNGD